MFFFCFFVRYTLYLSTISSYTRLSLLTCWLGFDTLIHDIVYNKRLDTKKTIDDLTKLDIYVFTNLPTAILSQINKEFMKIKHHNTNNLMFTDITIHLYFHLKLPCVFNWYSHNRRSTIYRCHCHVMYTVLSFCWLFLHFPYTMQIFIIFRHIINPSTFALSLTIHYI